MKLYGSFDLQQNYNSCSHLTFSIAEFVDILVEQFPVEITGGTTGSSRWEIRITTLMRSSDTCGRRRGRIRQSEGIAIKHVNDGRHVRSLIHVFLYTQQSNVNASQNFMSFVQLPQTPIQNLQRLLFSPVLPDVVEEILRVFRSGEVAVPLPGDDL